MLLTGNVAGHCSQAAANKGDLQQQNGGGDRDGEVAMNLGLGSEGRARAAGHNAAGIPLAEGCLAQASDFSYPTLFS
jgi:hypothetical protein